MPNLTDALIRAAKPPERGQTTLTDTTLPNFGLRLSQGGSKTFVVILGKGRRQTIGHYPLVSLADARKEARRLLAEKELGKVRPQRVSFDSARSAFLKDAQTRIKVRTLYDYRRILARFEFPALDDINPSKIIKQLAPLAEHPAERHHCFTVLKVFFTWCTKQDMLDVNPMLKLPVPKKPTSRERVLTEQELASLLRLLNASRSSFNPFHRIVELLILTGQRRGEVAALQWEWINQEERTLTFPLSITKNKRTHTIPYGDMVANVLAAIPRMEECPYVFPATRKRNEKTTVFNGWGKPKALLDSACGVTDWTLHDLRRGFSSIMASHGVPQVVVEKLLNHVSGGTLSPIAAVYNRHAYMNEMRDAILRYEAYLATLIAPTA